MGSDGGERGRTLPPACPCQGRREARRVPEDSHAHGGKGLGRSRAAGTALAKAPGPGQTDLLFTGLQGVENAFSDLKVTAPGLASSTVLCLSCLPGQPPVHSCQGSQPPQIEAGEILKP